MIWRGLIFSLIVLQGSALSSSGGDKVAPPAAQGNAGFPGYSVIAASPWQLRHLAGRQQFTFTMYGCPGSLDELKQLVTLMREKGLGNGFDPGPAACTRPARCWNTWPRSVGPSFVTRDGRICRSNTGGAACAMRMKRR